MLIYDLDSCIPTRGRNVHPINNKGETCIRFKQGGVFASSGRKGLIISLGGNLSLHAFFSNGA
jgi:hypothetical protein